MHSLYTTFILRFMLGFFFPLFMVCTKSEETILITLTVNAVNTLQFSCIEKEINNDN